MPIYLRIYLPLYLLTNMHPVLSTGSLPPESQMQQLLASLPPETRNVVESAMKGNTSSGGGASKVIVLFLA